MSFESINNRLAKLEEDVETLKTNSYKRQKPLTEQVEILSEAILRLSTRINNLEQLKNK
jgi:flagellar capping protein FliD